MAEDRTSLVTVYAGWENYQQLLVKALAPLSPEQLNLRAAPHLRSIGENATHMLGARARWFHSLMGEGGAEMDEIGQWDRGNVPTRDTTALLHGFEATWQVIQHALSHWTLEDLAYIYQGTRGGEDYKFSRQWVIWHVIEHDLHHGGEISFSLGMHGLTAPDL